jgi:hypothetical protein
VSEIPPTLRHAIVADAPRVRQCRMCGAAFFPQRMMTCGLWWDGPVCFRGKCIDRAKGEQHALFRSAGK